MIRSEKDRDRRNSDSPAHIRELYFAIAGFVLVTMVLYYPMHIGLEILNHTNSSYEFPVNGTAEESLGELFGVDELTEVINEAINETLNKTINNETTNETTDIDSNITNNTTNLNETRNNNTETTNTTDIDINITNNRTNTTNTTNTTQDETNITGNTTENTTEEYPAENITIELNNTIEYLTNETTINESIINKSTSNKSTINETQNIISNTSLNNTQNKTEITEVLIQGQAEIGKPVKWTKRLTVVRGTKEIYSLIPEKAENVRLNNQVVLTEKTGKGKEVAFTAEDQEYTITYQTPAPKKTEKNLGYKKRITISSEEHYQNISAWTEIEEAPENQIKLYWLKNGTREKAEFWGEDTDDDLLIEKVHWIVPHLSNETYELEITVLNVHSYPRLGGIWKIEFNTTGKANLTITPTKGTLAEMLIDDELTANDLDFAEIACGNESVQTDMLVISEGKEYHTWDLIGQSLKVDGLKVPEYECNSTGALQLRELYGGSHKIRFDFGNLSAYAENYVSKLDCHTVFGSCSTEYPSYTDIFHLNKTANSHAELNNQSDYGYSVCCGDYYGESVGTDCSATDAQPLFALSNQSNAHLENVTQGNYDFDVCMNSSDYFNISCDWVDTASCEDSGYDTCLASVSVVESGDIFTNLHTGDCVTDPYDFKICCGTNGVTPPPSVLTITINSSDGTNYTDANVTVNHTLTTYGLPVKNITNWYLNDTSIAVLNTPFEANYGQVTSAECNIDGSASNTGVACLGMNEDSTDATIDSCADGTNADYMRINNIFLNDSFVKQGDTVEVKCEVYCWGTGTQWFIAYNNGTSWTHKTHGACSVGTGQLENITYSLTVDDVDGTHNIRCGERWSTAFTTETCYTGTYSDTDDMSIAVGESTKDYSGNKNDGVVNGAEWGRYKGYDEWGAYEFDGGTSAIDFEDAEMLKTSNKFTVAMWVYANTISNYDFAAAVASPTANTNQSWQWYFDASTPQKMTFSVQVQGGVSAYPKLDMSAGEWTHIAGTFNGTNISIYKNGEFQTSASLTGNLLNNASVFAIGNNPRHTNGWDGLIDEFLFINRTLTPQQIKALYENKTDLIVSQETKRADLWKACVTPNDGSEDGSETCSDELEVWGCVDADEDGFNASGIGFDSKCGVARDCDDNNASIFPPYHNMTINTDTVLCGGAYNINDSSTNNEGGLFYSVQANVRCNGTEVYGNSSGQLTPRSGYMAAGITIEDCHIHNYSRGFRYASTDSIFDNMTMHNVGTAFYLQAGTGQTIQNSKFWGAEYTYPIYLRGLSATSQKKIINNTFNGSMNYAVQIYLTDNVLIQNNNFTFEGGGTGIYLDSFTGNSVDDHMIRDNHFEDMSTALYITESTTNITIYNNTIKNTGKGVYLYNAISGTPKANISNNIFNKTTSYSIKFQNQANGSVVHNNTFIDCLQGINLDTTSGNNTFYYNNFTGTLQSGYHYADDNAKGNYWNTTNGSNCGAQCARGNYWEGIENLEIYDLNRDGFGEYGTEYPYNSTNRGNITGNGYPNDYGPITSNTCYDDDSDGFYNTSSVAGCPGTYRDCDDKNASIFPPYENMEITTNVTLCNGTYDVPDSNSQGLIKSMSANTILRCNGTVIRGNTSGYWLKYNITAPATIRDCTITNYSTAIWFNFKNGIKILNNTFTDFSAYTFSGQNDDNTLIQDNNFTNLTSGIFFYGGDDNKIISNTFTNLTSGKGVKLYQGSRNNITGNTINCKNMIAGSIYGIYLYATSDTFPQQNTTVQDNNITDCYYGIFGTTYAQNATIKENKIHNATKAITINNNAREWNITQNELNVSAEYGIEIDSSATATLTNNTIRNCTTGVQLGSGTTGNLLYYNTFIDNSVVHANAEAGGNYFNTTVSGEAHGNNWDDINYIKIFDDDGNGFGEVGLEYPYNTTNSGNITGYVVDWGPITTRDSILDPPQLISPSNTGFVTDSRNPIYYWLNVEPTVSETIIYDIQIDDNSDFSSPIIYQRAIPEETIQTTYYNESELTLTNTYYWRVRGNDSVNDGEWSATWSFSILPTINCILNPDEVDFGSMSINDINDTTNDHPPPYIVENQGNLQVNATIWSTTLWESGSIGSLPIPPGKYPMPHEYYQFMVDEEEPNSYTWALNETWVNMTNVSTDADLMAYETPWQNTSDQYEVEIRLHVPSDEPPGYKYSTTTVNCGQNETY